MCPVQLLASGSRALHVGVVSDAVQPQKDLLESFRAAMRHVAATVYTVTTGPVGDRHGILATAVSSLSFEPPSLLVCINRAASLHEPLACADLFCVNVLGTGNRDVADAFASRRGEERFEVGDWGELHGVPILESAQSSFVCRAAHRHEFGTHTIFIGELLACHHRADAKPLTYYDRHYIDLGAPTGDSTAN